VTVGGVPAVAEGSGDGALGRGVDTGVVVEGACAVCWLNVLNWSCDEGSLRSRPGLTMALMMVSSTFMALPWLC
jgi:hypothetical protein